MTAELEPIGIKVETGGIEQGITALDRLADQGPKVEKSLKTVEESVTKTGKSLASLGAGNTTGPGLSGVAKSASAAADGTEKLSTSAAKASTAINSVSNAARSATSSQEALASAVYNFTKAETAYIQKLVDEAKQLGMNRSERERYIAQSNGMSVAAQQVAAAMGAKIDAYKAEQTELKKLAGASDTTSASFLSMTKIGVGGFLGGAVVRMATEAAKALYEASAAGERLRTMLDFSTGGNGAREIDYLRGVTQRLGLEFNGTAKAYGQFQAAAKGTALEGQKARDIFESIAKASAVMGLSTEQSSGALLALQQMISKGTVQAEELRGQLGERLPGAFQIAAKAMGVTTAELGKMLEAGQVVADDFLPKFARAMDANLGGSSEKAADRLDAAVNRFGNAWERLKQTIGDNVAASALKGQLEAITRDVTVFGETMDKVKASGGGLFAQLTVAGGAEVARAAFSIVNNGANILNGTINALTGSIFGLRTDLALLPDVLKTNAQQATAVAANLAAAEKEFKRLQDRGAATTENIYLRSAYADLARYIDKLKEAQAQQNALTQRDPRDQSGFTSRGQSFEAEAKRLQGVQDAMQKVLAGVSGVKESFYKDLNSLYAGYKEGLIKLSDYQAAVKKLISESGGGKVNDAAIKAVNKELEEQAKLMAELAGLSGDFAQDWERLNKQYKAGKLNLDQLLEAQDKLLKKQPFMRDAGKAEAKAIAEAAQAHEKYSASLQSGLDKILADIKAQQEHTERLGLSKTAIAQLDAAKLEMLATDKELQAIKVLDRNLDTEQYNLLKAQAQAYRDLAKAKVGGAVKEDAMDAAKKTAEEWKRATDDINRSLTDALLRGFESGKSFARNFRDTVVDMFKTLVLRPVISAIVNPVAGQLAGGLGGLLGAGSSLAGGVDVLNRGGIAGLGGAGGLYGLMSGGGFLGTASSVAGGVFGGIGELSSLGFGEALSGGLGALTSGSIGTGLATLTGVLGPIALGLGALSALAKAVDHSGTPHTGASSSFSSGQGLLTGMGLSGVGSKAGDYSAQTEQFTSGIVQGIVGILDSTAATFGKQAGYTAAAAFADDSSKDGAWGALAIKLGEQMVAGFGAEGNGKWPGRGFADGEAGTKEYLAAVSADVRSALDGIGLPSWAQGMLDKLGQAPTIEQLAGTVAQINATQAALVNLGGALPQLASVSGDAVTALLTAFGGVESLTQAAGSYYQNFYSDAERAATSTQQITKALADLGLALPNSRDAYRSLVEAQDLTTEAGRNTYAALLKLSPAFAEITAATATLADTTTKAAEQMAEAGRQALASLASDQASLMVDLLRAQGNSAGADSLARQQTLDKITAGLSASDAAAALAAYDYNDALRKQIEALNAAKTASEQLADQQKQQAAEALAQQQAVASQRTGLESQLLQLQGNTAALRERELAALDPSNRALQDQIYALQDQQAAAAAAAQALQALQSTLGSLGNTRFDLENQLLGLQGNSAEVERRTRERDLAQLTGGLSAEDAARVTAAYDLNAALRKQIADTEAAQKAAEQLAAAQAQAAAEQTRAAEQIKSAWQSVTDSIFDEVARIRGLVGESSGQSFANAQAQFAITTAQARAGDQEAAKLLPGLSQTLLQLAEAQATSLFELQYIRTQTAGSLSGTGNLLAGRYGLDIPRMATGTNYVPQDMLAVVHQGEAVVPRAFNPAAGGASQGNAELIAEVRALRAEVVELRKQVDVTNNNTGRSAAALEGRQSVPFLVEIAE